MRCRTALSHSMFSVFKTAWLLLSACVLGVSAIGSVESGLGEMLLLPVACWCARPRVMVINSLAMNFEKAACHQLNPLCVRHWEHWSHPALRHSLEIPPLSIVARFWESKTWLSQSHEPHCWEVGIMPLIAPRRKREGRWLQYVVVDFVLKSISFFRGGRSGDSIVEQRN